MNLVRESRTQLLKSKMTQMFSPLLPNCEDKVMTFYETFNTYSKTLHVHVSPSSNTILLLGSSSASVITSSCISIGVWISSGGGFAAPGTVWFHIQTVLGDLLSTARLLFIIRTLRLILEMCFSRRASYHLSPESSRWGAPGRSSSSRPTLPRTETLVVRTTPEM